jgi:hypothetical protein
MPLLEPAVPQTHHVLGDVHGVENIQFVAAGIVLDAGGAVKNMAWWRQWSLQLTNHFERQREIWRGEKPSYPVYSIPLPLRVYCPAE